MNTERIIYYYKKVIDTSSEKKICKEEPTNTVKTTLPHWIQCLTWLWQEGAPDTLLTNLAGNKCEGKDKESGEKLRGKKWQYWD